MVDKVPAVNRGAYMDFRQATDELFAKADHEDLAKLLGVSVASIRQAGLREEANAHRSPPGAWRDAVIRLAEEKAGRYRRLAEKLRTSGDCQ
jgi:hypothetical protein